MTKVGRKVLLLSHKYYPDIGGIETVSEFLANVFFDNGYDVHVLTWSEDTTGKYFPFEVIRNPGLYRIFREHSWADIIFENNPCLRLSWPNLFINRPILISLHTWISRTDKKIGWQDILKKRWLKRAATVIACSDAIRKRCWPKAQIIFNPFRKELLKELPMIGRSKDFVFLGRLVSDKGADLAIRAFAKLLCMENSTLRNNPGYTMTIIGDGPERNKLNELIYSLGVEEAISFEGTLTGKKLADCLNCHKYIIVPSVWEEPFGIVVLEGMACGCLPIVSDGGGLPEAVGAAGIVFKRGNVEDLKSCMERITNDSYLDMKLRKLIPGHLEAHSPENVSSQYLDIVRKSLKKNIS